MDFKSYLNTSAAALEEEIDQILSEFLNKIKKTNPKLIPFIIGFINSCRGGKRVRGTLVKLGYQIVKEEIEGQREKEILKVGAAYEIFHGAILIHDDIIDKSELRRGKMTFFKALGGDHHALSQSICLGDLGFFLSTKLISETHFPDKEKNDILEYFSKTMIDTALGEMLDIELPYLREKGEGERGKSNEEDVLTIMKLKTAQYTISAPLIIGAILADADEELVKALDEYGQNLGLAFQIQDDILGVFGSEDEIGKSASSDIEEGKNTLLIIEALKRANSEQKAVLEKYYGRRKVGEKGLEQIRKVFKESGALEFSREFALEYARGAKSVIPKISDNQQFIKILTEMADFLVERNK